MGRGSKAMLQPEPVESTQTCAQRPHIIILSFFLQSLGFVHLGESSLNICEEGSRETPEVEQMLEEVKRRSGLLVVNSYGADCVKGSICGADAPRLRSVLCLCRPAGWAADKITQHRAFVAMDNALDALEGPAPPAGELGALLAEFRRAWGWGPNGRWVLSAAIRGFDETVVGLRRSRNHRMPC